MEVGLFLTSAQRDIAITVLILAVGAVLMAFCWLLAYVLCALCCLLTYLPTYLPSSAPSTFSQYYSLSFVIVFARVCRSNLCRSYSLLIYFRLEVRLSRHNA